VPVLARPASGCPPPASRRAGLPPVHGSLKFSEYGRDLGRNSASMAATWEDQGATIEPFELCRRLLHYSWPQLRLLPLRVSCFLASRRVRGNEYGDKTAPRPQLSAPVDGGDSWIPKSMPRLVARSMRRLTSGPAVHHSGVWEWEKMWSWIAHV
jgi:hypothetical protein